MAFLHNVKRVGQRVSRCDNPCHEGVIVAVFGFSGNVAGEHATFRVLWDNGWREDCDRDEIE